MKKIENSILAIFVIFMFLAGFVTPVLSQNNDIDPLVDLKVTVSIFKIRSLEKDDTHLDVREVIDFHSDPDFYVRIIIDGKEFTSRTVKEEKYLYDFDFTATENVEDNKEEVYIKIQLWDEADMWETEDKLCDISPDSGNGDDAYDVEITYNLKNGHWTGDDYLEDKSGYGRLNGCEDGTIYEMDRDCELWFDITFNDYDGDGIPNDKEIFTNQYSRF